MTGAFPPVAAVVVTHNRRDLLGRALSGLEGQTRPPDLVIVIDNKSTDGTAAYLGERSWGLDHRIVRMSRNTGGAGGFAHGIDLAVTGGFSPWILDDDAVAQPGALEVLLADAQALTDAGLPPSFMCSAVEWVDGTVNRGNVPRPLGQWSSAAIRTGRPVVQVSSASFVSVLIPAAHVRAVGLPFAGYHKWYDDVEYTTRIYRRFGPGACSLESRVTHHTASNDGVLPWLATPASLDSHVMGLRNRASGSLTNRDMRGLMELARDLGRTARASRIPLADRGRLLVGAARGLWYRERTVQVGETIARPEGPAA